MQPLFDLEGARERHRVAVVLYDHLTTAELDRASLIKEVDRLQAENQRLQRLNEKTKQNDPSEAKGKR